MRWTVIAPIITEQAMILLPTSSHDHKIDHKCAKLGCIKTNSEAMENAKNCGKQIVTNRDKQTA